MGYWKNKQIEYQERGYSAIYTVICSGCVGDYALKSFIKNNGIKVKCDYCSKTRICCNLEDLIGHIVKSIKSEYEDATGCMWWDSKEGGFIGAETNDNYDIISDILAPEMKIENQKILLDVYNTLNDSIVWCYKDPYSLRIHEEDFYDWKEFCEYVKHSTDSFEDKASGPPILLKITKYLEELELIKTLNKNTGFYRSVIHNATEVVNSAKRIGSAPVELAKENRMSRQGVSMFYGAEDIQTTLVEIGAKPTDTVTSAQFYPSKRIQVLDLTKLESISFPSLFDDGKRHLRSSLIFMRNFALDVSGKCNGNVIEYLPTQVFTEHIRSFYKGIKMNGIIYNSSQLKGKKCCVLFFDNEHCVDGKNKFNDVLCLDRNSLKKIN